MRFGLLILALTLTLARGAAWWPGQSLTDIGSAPAKAEATRFVEDPGLDRLKAAFVGGFVGGGVGLVLGAGANALAASRVGEGDAVPAGPRTSYIVGSVALGVVVGGLGALLFPGPRAPGVALHSEPGPEQEPALVFDLCLVSLGF